MVSKREKYKTVGKNKDMFYENSYKNNATNFGALRINKEKIPV